VPSPDSEDVPPPATQPPSVADSERIADELAALRAELAALRAEIQR
jgi:hypothetical protein